MLRHGFLAVLVLVALAIQLAYRVSIGVLWVLLVWVSMGLFVGLAIGVFSGVMGVLVPELPVPQRIRRLWRLAPVPTLLLVGLSLVLLINGRQDRSTPVDEPWEVVRVRGTALDLGRVVPLMWMQLRSRAKPSQTIWLPMRRDEERRLWVGQQVIVQRRDGAFSIPWIAKIERDEEQRARQLLQAVPAAAEVWKQLIWFYVNHQRWESAQEAVQRYLALYPKDYDFAESVAASFGQARHYREQIVFLEPFLTSHPTFYGYTMVGFAYAHLGQYARAVELLQASIALDPESYWGYYELGYTYQWMGESERAIAMFEEVLKRRHDFPEIEAQLAALRNRGSGQ